jgi:hypothetical protein
MILLTSAIRHLVPAKLFHGLFGDGISASTCFVVPEEEFDTCNRNQEEFDTSLRNQEGDFDTW